jgi:uncharacterized protein YjdB
MKRFYLSRLVVLITLFSCWSLNGYSQTTTFSYTGLSQTYTVPPGVTLVSVTANGAQGGNAGDLSPSCHTGGRGSTATGVLTVTPGQTLYVYVGGAGTTNGTNSFGGGAGGGAGAPSCAGTVYGGGGGGASDVRTGTGTLADRVLVAAGGGGSGSGYTNCGALGAGGSGGAGDVNGSPAYNCGQGYPGGGINFGSRGLLTLTANGGPGDAGGNAGTNGVLGLGGAGAPGAFTVSGGGGGGGYYGGGGGGAASWGSGVGGGGGGGGSSYVGGVTSGVITTNVNSGNGNVSITVLCTAPGSIVGSVPFCVGSTITLTNPTGDPAGVWQTSNALVATVGSSTGVVTGVSAGTATITYFLGSPCGGTSATTTVTVNALPATITGPSSVCVNSTITLSDATSGGTWTSSNLSFATVGSSTGIVTGISAGNAVITYTAGSCSITTPVTINALPLNIAGTGAVCPGSTITLTDASPGGTWTSGNLAMATIGSSSGVVTGVSGGTPTITYTLPTGCLATSTVTVSSIGPITGGTGVCVGTTLTLSISAPPGTWTSSNPAVATIGSSSGIVTGLSAGTTNITYTAPSIGCSSASTISVSSGPSVFSVTGGGAYCSGGTGVNVGISGSNNGVSYQLYVGAVPTGVPVIGAGFSFNFGLQTTAGSYTIIANPGSGCATNMTGSVAVVINPLPTPFPVTGGGSYCSGGSGVHVFTSSSQIGVNYQLFNGITAMGVPVPGTSGSIDFGFQTLAGTDSVVGTNAATGCISPMSNTVRVAINPLPTLFSVTGGGGYCTGGTGVLVSLSGSVVGINYQLFRGVTPVGTAVAGTGSSLSFGLQTVAGVYTVVATNATTLCTSTMTGSATVAINPLPTIFTVTGGGPYCIGGTGVDVSINGSTIGVNYQLYRGVVPVGSPVAGTGVALSFGLQTIVGSYTVIATNGTTGCVSNMFGSVSVSTNPLPDAFTVTGGGGYCAGGTGLHVGLSGSTVGVNYQLFNASTLVGAASGSGTAIDFGIQTAAGVYTIVATNSITGCVNTMTGSVTITINPLPNVFTVTGGGSYCSGGTGVVIGLNGSNTGHNYQLFNGVTAVGAPVAGTGAAISFGLQTLAGSYTVVATNTTTLCTRIMTGSAAIAINPLPSLFNVSGGGGYCIGGSGVHIGLLGTNSGISYQLMTGLAVVGAPIIGTGAAIDFGFQTIAGTYTVIATNTATGCSSTMIGSVIVSINPLPAVQAVTGGGAYCLGGSGVHVGLNNSATTVKYQLFRGVTPVGLPVRGNGAALDFGFSTIGGTYTVVATDTVTGCVNNMSGSAVVTVTPLPVAYAVTGGGSVCTGGTGVNVGLASSTVGVNYQLYNGPATIGAPIAGTGLAINFGLQTAAGTYTVVATNPLTTCTNTMTGSVTITVNALPALYPLTGGGNYCFGTTGVHIGVAGSDVGTNYQLYLGVSTVGAPMPGTGAAMDFGLQTSVGTYTIVATNTVTGCSTNMPGSTAVNIDPLPNLHNVTGGGSYCPAGTGVSVAIDGSDIGTNYQLYNGLTMVGTPVAGTGMMINFGLQTAPGTYTVMATNALTGCSGNMTGSAVVAFYALPVVYNVTGGGNYCPAGAGVHVGLDGSNLGITYQLYNGIATVGSPVAGTGLPFDFGLQTLPGTYTVIATNVATSCTNNMNDSAIVAISPLPATHIVTGGGSYCAGSGGVHIGLDGTEAGITYQLYNGLLTSGLPMPGTGAAIDFGLRTASGTYTVVATATGTSCSSNMIGSANVTINPLPTAYTVIGGGSYCIGGTGVHVQLGGSNIGISYQLFRGLTAIGTPRAGTGAIIDFGLQTVAGTYRVVATNTVTGCTNDMSGTVNVVINVLPNVYSVMGGGNFCVGGTGVHVTLNGSNTGVYYQLYRGITPVGVPVLGTGSALDFGLQIVLGTYVVVATDATSGCTNNMLGSATIGTNPLPNIYSVSSTSSNYCIGGIGVDIALTGSQVGISYQLYHGVTAVGSPVAGTGASIDFGYHLPAGTYTVVAMNPSTGCTCNMASSVTVVIDPLPNAFTVTGGGNYCTGAPGSHVGLSGSNIGISYQLYVDGIPTGSPMAGTGGTLDFGLQTTTGVYTIIATNPATTCTNIMSSSTMIGISPLPSVYTVVGGGNYCASGPGVTIGLSGSETGVVYQLFVGLTAFGTPVSGTGGPIDFGMITSVGTYTVLATNTSTLCTNNMFGTATVGINSLPIAFTTTGGGNYCPGGAGVHVGLSGSNTGITYQLFNGLSVMGAPVMGTGSGIDFGLQTAAGTYTIVATDMTTACTANMSGSATVVINTLPAIFAVNGGGSYCSGSGGVSVGLNGSATGINYQLYNGIGAVGSPVAGTGGILDFGLQTVAGTYTVIATNATTTCSRSMAGSTSVTVNPVVTPIVNISTTAGDTICSGVFTTFTAIPVSGGLSPTYQWKVNGVVTGLSPNYSYTPVDGDVLSVTMTSSAACATPATANRTETLHVIAAGAPTVTVAANPGTTVCQGTSVTYSAVPVFGGSMPSYTWIKNGVTVGTSPSFTYTPLDGDVVSAVMTSNYLCRTSSIATSNHLNMVVDVPATPTVSISASPSSNVAPGQLVVLTATVTNGGPAPTYQWTVNAAAIPGAVLPVYTSSSFANGDVVACQVLSSGGCAGIVGSGALTVHVMNVGVNQVMTTTGDIKLLPNPNNGTFTVKGTLGTTVDATVYLEVTNMLGQVVYTNKITTHNGDINERIQLGNTLANGMYILNLRSATENKVFHLVIEQ